MVNSLGFCTKLDFFFLGGGPEGIENLFSLLYISGI